MPTSSDALLHSPWRKARWLPPDGPTVAGVSAVMDVAGNDPHR